MRERFLSSFHIFFILYFLSLFLMPARGKKEEPPEEFYSFDIQLTEEERLWIEKNPVIRVGGPLNFPPFYWTNEQKEPAGIGADYVRILLNNLGIRIEYSVNLPWPEVLKKTAEKELDLIAVSAYSSEREDFLNYTAPIISAPLVIISRKDSPFISGVDDLNGVKLALIEKNIVSEWLKDDRISFIPITVATPQEALDAVSVGKAEAYIENLAAATYLISEKGLTNLKVAAPTDYGYYDLHIAVRKDWPELVSILDRELSALSPQQRSRIQNNWLSVTYEYGIHPGAILRAVLIAGAIGASLLSASLLWNRRLAKEIVIRKKAETELKDAMNNIKTLQGLLPICSRCKSIRDDRGYWTELDKYIHENTQISFSHGLCPECTEKLYGKEEWYTKGSHEGKKT